MQSKQSLDKFICNKPGLPSTKQINLEIVEMAEILRIKKVCELTGLSRTTLWRLERAEKFPDRVQLSDRAVGWRWKDVEAWIKSRPLAGESWKEKSAGAPLENLK